MGCLPVHQRLFKPAVHAMRAAPPAAATSGEHAAGAGELATNEPAAHVHEGAAARADPSVLSTAVLFSHTQQTGHHVRSYLAA